MTIYVSFLLFALNLNIPTLALAAAAAAQCPPSYVFDENIPLHTSSCSAITLCVNDDASVYLPTDENIDAPCLSMLIALRCPEVVVVGPGADGEDGAEDDDGGVERKCEYSVLRWDENGVASQACCGSFDVVFKEPEEEYGDQEEFDDGEEEEEEDEDENEQGEYEEEDLEEDEAPQEGDELEFDEEDTTEDDEEEEEYDEEGDYEPEEENEAEEHEDL